MTTYFEPTANDLKFVDQINERFEEPGNQPYLFYLFAGKQFYQELMNMPVDDLILSTESIIIAYKEAFQSRYSLEELEKNSVASAALLAGSLTIVFDMEAHGLAIEIADHTLSVSQGPYAMQLMFDEDHEIYSLNLDF